MAEWRYMNDAGWWTGYTVGDDQEGYELVVISTSEQGHYEEVARLPLAQWCGETIKREWQARLIEYADTQELAMYEREGIAG